MDHTTNPPQLIRRAHSPLVAAASAASAVETSGIQHQLHAPIGGHNRAHSHGQNHSGPHGHHQQHLNPHGLASPPASLETNSAHHLHAMSGTHTTGISSATSTTTSSAFSMNGNIPFASTASAAASLGLSQDSSHQHSHHDAHGHGHDHDHGHDHSHSHSHDPSRIGNPPPSPVAAFGQSNGYAGSQLFQQQQQHQHHGHDHDHHHDHHGHHGHHDHHHTHDHHSHDHGHGHGHGNGHGHEHGHGNGFDKVHPFEHNHQHAHSHGHNHNHNHHDHSHSHGHGHDHHHHHHGHGHDHAHDHGHGHGHEHVHYPVSYRSQLPSVSDIFAGLMPDQKTKFTWLIAHSSYAFFIWFQGMRTGSLAAVGWGYMMLFDAFGIFNSFVTSVVLTDRNLRKSTVKNPFGVQRYEVLLGLCNAIFLLFIGMNMLKESLEHLMLEGHHGGDHESSAGIPLIWTLLGLGVTLVSAVGYQNHHQFCQLMGTGSTLASLSFDHSVKGNSRTLTQNVLFQLIRNPFTIMTLSCGLGVLAVSMLPMFEGLDKFIAIGQSIAMFMLGGPLAKTLGMIILQTSPPRALSAVEEAVRQLSTENPAIQRIEKAHVWTNSYGQLIGTLVVSVAKGSDEQSTLASIHQRLHSLLDLGDTQSQKQVDGSSELTVQLVQGQ